MNLTRHIVLIVFDQKFTYSFFSSLLSSLELPEFCSIPFDNFSNKIISASSYLFVSNLKELHRSLLEITILLSDFFGVTVFVRHVSFQLIQKLENRDKGHKLTEAASSLSWVTSSASSWSLYSSSLVSISWIT